MLQSSVRAFCRASSFLCACSLSCPSSTPTSSSYVSFSSSSLSGRQMSLVPCPSPALSSLSSSCSSSHSSLQRHSCRSISIYAIEMLRKQLAEAQAKGHPIPKELKDEIGISPSSSSSSSSLASSSSSSSPSSSSPWSSSSSYLPSSSRSAWQQQQPKPHKKRIIVVRATSNPKQVLAQTVNLLAERNLIDIRAFSPGVSFTTYVVVVTTYSIRSMMAAARSVYQLGKKTLIPRPRVMSVECAEDKWSIVDLGSVMVHIFADKETRVRVGLDFKWPEKEVSLTAIDKHQADNVVSAFNEQRILLPDDEPIDGPGNSEGYEYLYQDHIEALLAKLAKRKAARKSSSS
eukprot:TRINITY_DN4884_c0_g1_i1.p1 TRINITY_DN4884_c0_g1~~TRINITY_DN4884_c0_g1_i1.p1  ORF type:complete len:346 (+),score=116.34 TRINITY_DN4884_c0_g1_i1:169-1206(+)